MKSKAFEDRKKQTERRLRREKAIRLTNKAKKAEALAAEVAMAKANPTPKAERIRLPRPCHIAKIVAGTLGSRRAARYGLWDAENQRPNAKWIRIMVENKVGAQSE
jgi:hypothetical protein